MRKTNLWLPMPLLIAVVVCVCAQACVEPAASNKGTLAAGTGGIPAGAAGSTAGSTAPLPSAGTGGAGTSVGDMQLDAGAGAAGASGMNAGAGGGAPLGSGGTPAGDGGVDGGIPAPADPTDFAAGLHELFMHDACTGENPSQPDTCLHAQQVEQKVTFGGETGTVYDVALRVRGLFEPTTISGGQAPLPQDPYFKVGGSVGAPDWSRWHIEVSDPPQTYWLNHYPSTSHTIYKEDFDASIQVAAGATVTVRVIDGNDRQMDNAEQGLADRRQLIEGVTAEVLDGQMLRLDVVSVKAR